MDVVFVHITVKEGMVEPFISETIENARNSSKEPGIFRFDLSQDSDNPQKFILIEVYKTPDAVLAHKNTPHYLTWRDRVAGMMAEPRTAIRCEDVYPKYADCNAGVP